MSDEPHCVRVRMRWPGAGVFVLAALVASHARADGEPVDVWVDGAEASPLDPVRDPTAASFVLDGTRLDRPGRSAADALARVPGVEVTRAGGGADLATASLRGTTSAQTPIHLAGIRLNDDLTGTADLSTLPLWLLKRIEIDRGNAPIASDRLGLGGAIFFDPIEPSQPFARASYGMGSFGQREARFATAFATPAASVLVALRQESASDDYEFIDDRGTRFDATDDRIVRRRNADHSQVDWWTIGRWEGARSRIRAVLNVVDREAGAPGIQLVPAEHARAALRRGLGGMAGEHACGDGCLVEWAVDGLVTRYRLDDPLGELGGARSTDNAGERSRQRVRLRTRPAPRLDLSVGLAQEVQRLGVAQGDSTVNARRHVGHADVEARTRIAGRVQAIAVAALDCHSTTASGTAQPCGILAPSARIGARVRGPSGFDAFANVGRYVREPTLGELYGISSVLRGNEDLRPEIGQGFDLGVSMRGERGRFSGYAQLDGFARWSSDLIGFRRSSFGAVRPYNVGAARSIGVEAVAGGRLAEWAHASVSLTWLDPRDTSDSRLTRNDLLPFLSRFVAAPAVEFRAPAWRALRIDGAGLAVRYLHRSARVADPAGIVVLPALSQLDLELDATLAGTVAARARLANLFDQRTFDLLGYPLPGRAGYVTVELQW